jgi:hypothetical protein
MRGDYLDDHPTAAWLVIEVADSSLDRDRAKATVYAAAGVLEHWLVNLVEGVFEVHAGPAGEAYARLAIATYRGNLQTTGSSFAIGRRQPLRGQQNGT